MTDEELEIIVKRFADNFHTIMESEDNLIQQVCLIELESDAGILKDLMANENLN